MATPDILNSASASAQQAQGKNPNKRHLEEELAANLLLDPEIDELRSISRTGKQFIAEMEERERQRTGISSLKIRYNRVFGYYIEITKTHLASVPADYIRKQTVAGGERYITPALKEYEDKVLGADERIAARELELFDAIRGRVSAAAPRVLDTARAVAALDALAGLEIGRAHV